MKRIMITSLLAIVLQPVSFAQIDKGKTDLEKENLKGNVSCVIESKRWEEEKWGEIEVKLETIEIEYFDSNGFKMLTATKKQEGQQDVGILRRFNRDEKGRLSSVNYYYHGGDINVKSYDFNILIGKEIHEYYPDGNLKSITFENTNDDYRSDFEYYVEYCYDERPEIDIRRELWVKKIIYRYDAPLDYTVIVCDRDGNTMKTAKVSENGKRLTNDKGICSLDKNGNMISRGGSIVAGNGAVTYSYFYGYNKQGDLVLETGKEEGIKEVDNAPWLVNQYKFSGDMVYEYSYDSNDNWVVKKVFRTRVSGKEEDRSEARARTIKYGDYRSFTDLENDPSKGEMRRLKILIQPEDLNDELSSFYNQVVMFENDKTAFLESVQEYTETDKAYNSALEEYKTARMGKRVALASEIENKKNRLNMLLNEIQRMRSQNLDYINRIIEDYYRRWTDRYSNEDLETTIQVLKNSFGEDSSFIPLLDKTLEYLAFYKGVEIPEES